MAAAKTLWGGEVTLRLRVNYFHTKWYFGVLVIFWHQSFDRFPVTNEEHSSIWHIHAKKCNPYYYIQHSGIKFMSLKFMFLKSLCS